MESVCQKRSWRYKLFWVHIRFNFNHYVKSVQLPKLLRNIQLFFFLFLHFYLNTLRNFETEAWMKDLFPKLYNGRITNQSGKLSVLSEVVLYIQLLLMIIRGKSPSLLLSSYATVINRNDKNIWLDILRLKRNRFSKVTVYESIYKNARLCYRYTKVNKYYITSLHSSN